MCRLRGPRLGSRGFWRGVLRSGLMGCGVPKTFASSTQPFVGLKSKSSPVGSAQPHVVCCTTLGRRRKWDVPCLLLMGPLSRMRRSASPCLFEAVLSYSAETARDASYGATMTDFARRKSKTRLDCAPGAVQRTLKASYSPGKSMLSRWGTCASL